APVYASAGRQTDLRGGELSYDEEFVDDELHLLGVEKDMAAPPLLEFKIARRLGIDLRIEVVLLRPDCVRRVQAFEVRDEPRTVELAVAEVTHKCGEPAPAKQPARVAHRVLAAHAGP